jgi:hypothetical protein
MDRPHDHLISSLTKGIIPNEVNCELDQSNAGYSKVSGYYPDFTSRDTNPAYGLC